MNNAFGSKVAKIPLTVFGGAVTDMAPSDLPEGACPWNQDVDFLPGSVFTRGGRQNVYTFNNIFIEDITGVAQSVAGSHAPNEAAWTNPTNATLNIPGTYAAAQLNTPVASTIGIVAFDKSTTSTGSATPLTTPSLAPANINEWALMVNAIDGAINVTPESFPPGWADFDSQASGARIQQQIVQAAIAASESFTNAPANWASALALFNFAGNINPVALQTVGFSGGLAGGAHSLAAFGVANIVNNSILFIFRANAGAGAGLVSAVSDSRGNIYTKLAEVRNAAGSGEYVTIWFATGITAGANTVSYNTVGGSAGVNIQCSEMTLGVLGAASNPFSQVLKLTNFGFNIPLTTPVIGFVVEVFGHQTTQAGITQLTLSLINPSPTSPSYTFQLPAADSVSTFPFGANQAALAGWGLALTPALLNNPNFGVQLAASAADGTPVTFDIYAVKIKAFLGPAAPANFDYIKTYEQQAGSALFTLALDANGILWQEDVINAPTQLSSIYTSITPNTFAKSVTFQGNEYIAFSDLVQGTDMPRQWNGVNLDRVSQVAPGAAPSVSVTVNTNNIVASPLGITQAPANSDPASPGHFNILLLSSGPGSRTLGNVLTVYYKQNGFSPIPDPLLVAGGGVVLAGIPVLTSGNANGNYVITSVGLGTPPGGASTRFYFTVTTSFSGTDYFNVTDQVTGTYQLTLATLTTTAPVPNVQVGSQITLAGVGIAAWNSTWTVTATPNAAQYQITATLLTGNIATYNFNLISGALPVVGQQISITGCLNGPIIGNTSIFNVANATISSVGLNQFSIQLVGPNVTPAAEPSASAIISGTVFQFDPGPGLVGAGTSAIFGNSGGGTIVASGGNLGAGTRQAVLIYKTRNNALTPAGPPVTFTTSLGAQSIAFTNVGIGPPDVVARIIAVTGANGGNFFWIPLPITVQTINGPVLYTSTVINDNTSTQAVFTFTDAILLTATAIDIQGNNLFAQRELGSCRGFLTYADRLIAWGEQTKIQNMLNLSFDGGTLVNSVGSPVPLGWTVDAVNGGGVAILTSPLFGNSFYAKNATGGAQALYGMIEQGATLDAFQQQIVRPATTYSVRVTARCPSGVQTGSLVIDFFSPNLNQQFGVFSVALSSMTSNMQIFSGTLLRAPFASAIPKDLLFRVYLSSVPNNGDVEIDRVEPFETLQPNFSTNFIASYAFDQEAFDSISGSFGPAQNQQRANGGMVLFDLLYMLKENSWYSTSDNGVTEPFRWNWREVSPKVGTIGIHSYDYGEGWALTACRAGIYFFEGGEPIKISQEIQSVWDLINWSAGATIWLRNDEATKTVKVAVPIATPNIFMPEFPVNANPTSPNVVLSMSYRELNTGAALAATAPIRSSFSGRLLAPEPARKWSFWNISAPCGDNIDRGNNSKTLFYGSGYTNSKIYQLLASQLSDDGAALNSYYLTHGFPKPEIAEARGIDVLRSQFDYMTLNVTGSGNLKVFIFPEDPRNPLPYTLDSPPLDATTQGDTEIAVNVKGQRHFIRIGTNAVGAAFACSQIIGILSADPWSPVRGTARGNAS